MRIPYLVDGKLYDAPYEARRAVRLADKRCTVCGDFVVVVDWQEASGSPGAMSLLGARRVYLPIIECVSGGTHVDPKPAPTDLLIRRRSPSNSVTPPK